MADLRQACDRCHDKKLRCPKVPGRPGFCTRCAKAGVPCVFSPPTRTWTVSSTRKEPWSSYDHGQGVVQALEDTMMPMRPDWTDLMDFDPVGVANDAFLDMPGPMENPIATPLSSAPIPPQTSSPTKESPGTDASDIMNQLAAIITALESSNQPLASLRGRHTTKDRIQDWADELRQSVDLSKFLESLLTSAQNLSSLYATISALVSLSSGSSTSPDEDCPVPDCIHEYDQDRLNTTSSSPAQKNYVLLNLLLSCHLKLLDTVDTIITHCHTCSRFLVMLPDSTRESRFDIPEIRIGSFVAPKGAAASLFTTMLYQLLMDLRDRNRDLAEALAPDHENRSETEPSRETKVLKLQAEIISARTGTALEDIRGVKARMLDMGIIK